MVENRVVEHWPEIRVQVESQVALERHQVALMEVSWVACQAYLVALQEACLSTALILIPQILPNINLAYLEAC